MSTGDRSTPNSQRPTDPRARIGRVRRRRDRFRSRNGQEAVHHVELPGRVRRPDAHAAAGAAGHSGAVPRHVPSLPADARLPRRADGALEAEPDQPAREGAAGGAVGAREHAGLLRAPQGGAALQRARGLRHLVHGAAPRSVAVAREPEGSRAVPAAGQGRSRASRRSPAGTRATSGSTRRTTTSRCCRSTSSATRASAASRAPRRRSIPNNPRSGRWKGEKLECGIHIQAK